jgi:hypothetical protein
MPVKRLIVGAVAALAGMATAVAVAAPADAAASTTHAATGQVLAAAAAPRGARPMSAAAVSPTISPSVTTYHKLISAPLTCPSSTFCIEVFDSTTVDYKVFNLFACHTYSVHNWLGWAYYVDNQTPGTISYVYGQSGNQIGLPLKVDPSHEFPIDVTPVWSIKNC